MSLPLPQAHQDQAIERIVDEESLLVEYGTGTGKTRVIVEVCKILVSAGDVPILVVVPNSLLEQTLAQFVLWGGRPWTLKHVDLLDGSYSIYQRREKLKRGRASVMILSHEALSYALIREGIRSRDWGAALVDEASRFRNYSKRTITLKALGSRARTRYAFTGNLTVRNPADSWYVMNFLSPGIFGTTSRETFITTYCLLGGFTGSQPIGVRPDKLAQLNAILDSKRIQAELRDIRTLPERTLLVRRVDLLGEQKRAYHQMRQELKVEIERTTDDEFETRASTYAVRLLRLQEIAAGFTRNTDGEVEFLPSPKTSEMLEALRDNPTLPTVIWYWWRPELEVITGALTRAGLPFTVFGERNAVEMFMAGGVDIFVSQLSRGGYGLNLTRAERMIYHSLPWDLDVYTQSQERNMRLDTTADKLTIEHYVIRDSVDEYVRSRLLDKAGMSRQLSRSQALEMLT
jgi:SNF2 family DNA or RNA helicase